MKRLELGEVPVHAAVPVFHPGQANGQVGAQHDEMHLDSPLSTDLRQRIDAFGKHRAVQDHRVATHRQPVCRRPDGRTDRVVPAGALGTGCIRPGVIEPEVESVRWDVTLESSRPTRCRLTVDLPTPEQPLTTTIGATILVKVRARRPAPMFSQSASDPLRRTAPATVDLSRPPVRDRTQPRPSPPHSESRHVGHRVRRVVEVEGHGHAG